jgi:hypothetical protein
MSEGHRGVREIKASLTETLVDLPAVICRDGYIAHVEDGE